MWYRHSAKRASVLLVGLLIVALLCQVFVETGQIRNHVAAVRGLVEMSSSTTKDETKAALDGVVTDAQEHQPNDDFCFYDTNSPLCCSPQRCEVVHRSSMASACCGTDPPQWPLLITGTPRSGTVFVMNTLNQIGLKMQDDWHVLWPKYHGMVSWIHIMKDNKYFGKGRIGNGTFGTVYHQLRNPLESLTSIAYTEPMYRPTYNKFLQRHISISERNEKDSKKKKIHTALEFYVAWHSFIDSLHVPMFRLEDLSPHLVTQITRQAGINVTNTTKLHEIFNKPMEAKNGRKHAATLEWHQLCVVNATLTNVFWDLVRGYGYYKEMMMPPCKQTAVAVRY